MLTAVCHRLQSDSVHFDFASLQDFLCVYQRGGGEAGSYSMGLQDAIRGGDV